MIKRNLTGLYNSYDDAKRAVEGLEAAGIPAEDISVIASDAEGHHSAAEKDAGAGAAVGGVAGGAAGLLAGLGMLAIPGIGPVVAAGWFAATLAGAAVGAGVGAAAGGLVGALTEAGLSEHDAHVYAESVRRGGTFVTARVDEDQAGTAEAILRVQSIDPVARGARYRDDGWRAFDAMAVPYPLPNLPLERDLADRDPRHEPGA